MKTKKEDNITHPLTILCTFALGMLFFVLSVFPPARVGMVLILMGISFCCVTLFLAFQLFSKFRQSRRGAIYVWAVCLLSIAVLAIGWFTLTWPAYMLIELIESIYAFPPEATAAITLIKNMIGWFLIIMAFGLLLWAILASTRREEVTYPIG